MIHTPGGEWGLRMRHYKVNKITHAVFEDKVEIPNELHVVEDWRDGHLGDWVKTDDGCVIQILREGTMIKPKGKIREVRYVGTCTGTFVVSKAFNSRSLSVDTLKNFAGSLSLISYKAFIKSPASLYLL